MVLSESFSDKTSSTLPIIISFSTNIKSKGTRKIRDFLRDHPDCNKYITKGPNFVADDNNEFRLYYVDSSLYQDEGTLKKLNIQKEEIVFGSSTEDSLSKPPGNSSRKREHGCQNFNFDCSEGLKRNSFKRIDKSIMCCSDASNKEIKSRVVVPNVAKRVSKSFQIGPDLRFNVVYVNTDNSFPITGSYYPRTNDAIIQTESGIGSCVSRSITNHNREVDVDWPGSRNQFRIRESPSFICDKTSSSLKHHQLHQSSYRKKLTTFKSFCSKMESRYCPNRYVKNKEFGLESEKGVNLSVKRSPSFVANYVLNFLQRSRINQEDALASRLFQSVVNYLGYQQRDNRKEVHRKEFYDIAVSSIISASSFKKDEIKKDKRRCRNIPLYEDKKTEKKDEENRKGASKDSYFSFEKYINSDSTRFAKLSDRIRYPSPKVELLFKCQKRDFFVVKSHYAILKKYYAKLKRRKNERKKQEIYKKRADEFEKFMFMRNQQRLRKLKFPKYNIDNNKNYRNWPKYCNVKEDCGTRTTISGFLHSFKPWHWVDNSKLSIYADEDCFTEKSNSKRWKQNYRGPKVFPFKNFIYDDV